MRTKRITPIAPFLMSIILPCGISYGQPAAIAHDGTPHVSDRRTCICDEIPAGGVGWCGRHARGFAYGHVLRTWPLLKTLLPVEDGPDTLANSSGAKPVEDPADQHETASNEPEMYQGVIPLLSEASLLKMVNAFPRGEPGSEKYSLTTIPGLCASDHLFRVNGHVYRSWVAAAMEAGQPLPALTAVASGGSSSGVAATPAAERPDASAPVKAGASALEAQRAIHRDPRSALTAPAVATEPDTQSDQRDAVPVPGCDECERAFAAGVVWSPGGFPPQPYCEKCGVGVVAGRVFTGRAAYELARAAEGALAFHRLHRCERCGAAILLGGRCTVCAECRQCHGP